MIAPPTKLIPAELPEAPHPEHYPCRTDCDVSCLLGHVLGSIEHRQNTSRAGTGDELIFRIAGAEFCMWHDQDCCESVTLDDIAGDLGDLVGFPLTMAEEVSSEPPDGHEPDPESETWTFYKFATIQGSVTLRWYGSSNGYYSERVDFARTK